MQIYITDKPNIYLQKRAAIIFVLFTISLCLTFLGPWIVFYFPIDWLTNSTYLFVLPQLIFPSSIIWFAGDSPGDPPFPLSEYGIMLSLLQWVPLAALFSWITRRLYGWMILLLGFLYINVIMYSVLALIKTIGWTINYDVP